MNQSVDDNSGNQIPLRNVRKKALSYLDGRRLGTGGFCYFKSWGAGAPSTLDTHAALLAFSFFDCGDVKSWRSDEQTRIWVRERLLLEISCQDTIGVWHLCASVRLLGDRFSEEDRLLIDCFLKKTENHFLLEQKSADGEIGPSASLATLIAWNRLADLSGWTGARPLSSFYLDNPPSTLLERFYRWEMDVSGWYPERLVPSVDLSSLESSLSGYVLTEGSTATDIAVIASGVLIAVKEGDRVPYPKAVLDWVMDSQGASGGFGRIPGAVPDLVSTAQALLIMNLLAEGREGLERLFPDGLWWSLQEN